MAEREYRNFIEDGYIYVFKRSEECYVLSKSIKGESEYSVPVNAVVYSFDEVKNYWINNIDKRYTQKSSLESYVENVLHKWDRMSASELKAELFSCANYKFKDDDIKKYYSNIPLCYVDGKAITVDECKKMYINYLGDDEARAKEYLSMIREAKQYIRTVVDIYKGQE